MIPGWKAFRPAIWLAMLGVALILLVSPAYFGAIFLGAAIGIAIRIEQARRRGVGLRRRGGGGTRPR